MWLQLPTSCAVQVLPLFNKFSPLVTQLQAVASSFKEPSSYNNNPLPRPHLMVTGNLVHQKGECASAVMISSISQHVDVEIFKSYREFENMDTNLATHRVWQVSRSKQ